MTKSGIAIRYIESDEMIREIIRESSPATNPVFSRGCEEFNNKI
jgi:hypothetical protein